MRILFINRATMYSTKGGDTVQMENTARELRNLGIQVSIERCDNKQIPYKEYQLIHFFNIIRPADILFHIRKSKLPFVISPIYLEYQDANYYGKKSVKGLLLSLLNKHVREYLKCIARYWKNGERIVSKRYLLMGHKRALVYILKRCSYLLPNSQSEYKRLKKDFPVAGAYRAIPNAINTALFNFRDEEAGQKAADRVLCVARFERKKNQLNLIKALRSTRYQLTLAGNIAPNHIDYYRQCVAAAAGGNVTFLDFPAEQEIVQLYKTHKVHVLPSWFETTGLSTLEAIACGCNIVITDKGDTREYFGNHACYCDPASPASIREAIEKAMAQPMDKTFMKQVSMQYNWGITARETLKVYQKIILHENSNIRQQRHPESLWRV